MSESPNGSPPAEAAQHRGDTRARIQEVAVELFTEQGYDKTSLREIAERLDVTKAALYYHFKSKEDLIRSLVDDYFGQVEALAAWAAAQPRTPAKRAEILSRYLDLVIDSHHVYRMLHHNQAALASIDFGEDHRELFKKRMNAIVEMLADPGAPLPERVRAATAATGVSLSWMLFHDQVDDPEALRQAVLGVAYELVGADSGTGQPAAAARTSGSTR